MFYLPQGDPLLVINGIAARIPSEWCVAMAELLGQ